MNRNTLAPSLESLKPGGPLSSMGELKPASPGTRTRTLFARKRNASVTAAAIALTVLMVTLLAFLLVRAHEGGGWADRSRIDRWKSWSVLATGSILTTFLAFSFLQYRRYANALESRVADRTHELGRACQQLQADRAVLIQTDQELRQANRALAERERQLVTALADLKRAHEALKSTQLQLIQAEKLESIGKLAAGVAHEVKNPLQTMIMGLTFLQRRLEHSDEQVKTTFSDMQEAVERADSIIRGLLQMSGSPDLHMTLEDVNALIERALSLVNYSLNANRINLVRHLDPDLPKVWLDHGKIEQVFLNLFSNAIHAMPNGGTLFVTTSATPEWGLSFQTEENDSPAQIVIEIQDTGGGIAAEHLSKLFTPFFTTKKKGLGTGLGLSVTKSIIELHGGHIDLSNAPEGGAKSTVMFQVKSKRPYEKSANIVCR